MDTPCGVTTFSTRYLKPFHINQFIKRKYETDGETGRVNTVMTAFNVNSIMGLHVSLIFSFEQLNFFLF